MFLFQCLCFWPLVWEMFLWSRSVLGLLVKELLKAVGGLEDLGDLTVQLADHRSEEGRVGKEGRSRWLP